MSVSFITLHGQDLPYENTAIYKTKFDDAIAVLNVATFHMGETTDANVTEFDEKNKENQLEVAKMAKLLAEFQPTVIIIEDLPINDSVRQADYQKYVHDPDMKFDDPNEIELLAYEVGRLSGARRIYGIDFEEGYNYNVGEDIEHPVDNITNNRYWSLLEQNEEINPEEGIPFYNLFKLNNHPQYLESLMNINADLLTYISSKGHSEGADEAAKFYHRNLVMFSNLNQLELNSEDRVFILMGGTHTAFFDDFLKRSPKYQLVNTFKYLK